MKKRRPLTDVVFYAAVAGLAVIAVAFLHSGATGLAVDAYLLFLAALALLAATRLGGHLTGPEEPSEIELLLRPERRRRWRRPRIERRQLPELARLEREVSLASGSAFDLHVRLRPTIREISEYRLLNRYGVVLDEEPQRARALLGEEVWELVRPGREPPAYRHDPGLSARELTQVVDALERL